MAFTRWHCFWEFLLPFCVRQHNFVLSILAAAAAQSTARLI